MRSLVSRHPIGSFLVAAYAIFWASWLPVLFLGASPRLFSALARSWAWPSPTYLTVPFSAPSAIKDLSVLMIVLPFAICFRILIALQPHGPRRPDRRYHPRLVQ